MKVYQIFSHGFAPCAPYFGYMQAIMEMADEYTLIAPENFMGSRAKFVSLETLRAMVPKYLLENKNGARYLFDPLRARYLSLNFDQVYLDIDVQLLRTIALTATPQAAGPGVLVGNGNPEDGARAWETYLGLSPAFCRPADLMFAGMSAQPPPRDSFHHHCAHGDYF